MDLSDFTKKIEVLPEKVKHTDDDTGEDKEANEVCVTWKHNSLSVSELTFYLRENHEEFENKVNAREQEILKIWMQELGYDSKYYIIENKAIAEKGLVTDQGQIDTWKKPNPETHVPAEDTEVL
jgi:hypothetical protein|tara:strand:+ start:59 stop:430 length:372 start_codon:yes stop_codon:yes gene_type:complete